jgi:hypothetical protein
MERTTLQETGPVRTVVVDKGGLRTVYATNQKTKVKTTIQTGRKDMISDPELMQARIPAARMFLGTEGDSEQLFPDYRVRKDAHKFFQVGRVFVILWAE